MPINLMEMANDSGFGNLSYSIHQNDASNESQRTETDGNN